jgi:hypothetical protein
MERSIRWRVVMVDNVPRWVAFNELDMIVRFGGIA